MPHALQSQRILIAEDDDRYAFLLERMLLRNGESHEITKVHSLAEAKAVIKSKQFDLYLFDFQFEEGTSIELLEEMKPGARYRTIVLTGREEEDIPLLVLEAGAADFLPKSSMNLEGLRRAIRYTLQKAAMLDALHERERELARSLEALKRQQQIEARLKSFESHLAAILNNTDDHVWSIDREYRLLTYNRSFAEHMRQFGQAIHPGYYTFYNGLEERYRTFWKEQYDRALGGEHFVLERPSLLDPARDFEIAFTPVHNGELVTGVAVYRREITRRKSAERELLSAHAYLSALLNNTSDSIWSIDLDRKIVWMNEPLREAVKYYYGVEIHPGDAPVQLVGEEGARLWDSWYDRAFAGENVRASFPIPFGGSERIFDLQFNPVRLNHEIVGVAVFGRDVTEDKELERQLRSERDRAEQMNRLKSAFLANMSHEIRTPLTAILGYATLLTEELSGSQHGYYAQTIERSGRRLLETINGILDLARIESGSLVAQLVVTNVASVVDQVITMLTPIAKEKRLMLEWSFQESDSVIALTDVNLLEQILTNVVGNALKFTDHGGVLVELKEDGFGSYTITVSDTGIGIGEHFLPYVFDEFKQESVGLDRTHEGTGLGLTITKRLTELLGGTVRVASTGPEGSVFELTFPLHPSPGLRAEHDPTAAQLTGEESTTRRR
jgi:signal transduction histidine kinase/DNA-binding response OmpR family regulator